MAQTVKLVAEGASWAKEVFQTTISPEQLIYSPVSDVLTLATGGRLEEAPATRIEIEIDTSDGLKAVVALKRGRNRNISVSIEGRKLGERLMDLEHPFTVYAPGLAGIARSERLLSAGVVRRTVARADVLLFATEFSDVEGYFLNAAHLHALNSELSIEQIESLIEEAIASCANASIAALINQRTSEAFSKRKIAKDQVDHGAIAIAATNDYQANPRGMCRGKIVVKKLASLMQGELKSNPRIYHPSAFLQSPFLSAIASNIWQTKEQGETSLQVIPEAESQASQAGIA